VKTIVALSLMLSAAVRAGEVTIVDVRVECPSTCTFSVTLEHADEGWNHYADQWDVLTLDGRLLGKRVLYHPHENEQPFTRSLSGIAIPAEIERVKIRAKDSKHGYSEREFVVDLPDRG
jgi:hypothetical protein